MSRLYQIHEFAELAGVTVKALHHYDRLGLLKAGRTGAGYRRYSERDLGRLEQIIALKFLGFPLKQIRAVLERSTPGANMDALREALRLQRQALEEKQMLLGRAIRAIGVAEASLEARAATDPALLKKIIEVLAMQDGIEQMKKYYSTEEAWEKRRRYYEEGPSAEWQALYRDVSSALDVDPGSDQAQALGERWLALSLRAMKGDPELQTDSPTAWMDREHWPAAMKQRIAEFNLDVVYEFIATAAAASRKKYFSEPAWARLVALRRDRFEMDASEWWQARVDLFSDIERALPEDPGGARARELAERWMAQVEHDSAGDPEIKAGVFRVWADRSNWSEVLRWQKQGLYMMPHDRFLKCADWIDRSVARRTG